MAILMHGDAAFAGQGLVYETLAMSQLIGYRTGGTVHVIVNNQIGFTTVPAHAYSGLYCTDVAKSIQAPILHVNGDDPEAVMFCARMAAEFRMRFACDIVLDIVCYRRHGHNETDEPAFTQPLMYRAIGKQKTTRTLYAERLAAEGVVPAEEAKAMWDDFARAMDEANQAAQAYKPNKADWLEGHWAGFHPPEPEFEFQEAATAVPEATLKQIGMASVACAGRVRGASAHRPPVGSQAGDAGHRPGHRLGHRRGAGVRLAAAGRQPRAAVRRGLPSAARSASATRC